MDTKGLLVRQECVAQQSNNAASVGQQSIDALCRDKVMFDFPLPGFVRGPMGLQ